MFSSNRYWGKDESKPKSTLTLEALHHLAQQRALERSRKGNQGLLSCKKESSDDELNSDGGTRIGDEDKGTRDESEDNDPRMEYEISSSSSASDNETSQVIDEHDDSVDPPNGSDEDTTPTLAPLSRSKPGGMAGKKGVHRQLPEWILNPQIVENDIQGCSRPIDDFSIHQILSDNLTNSGVEKFFPVQVHVIPFLLSTLSGPLLTGPGGSTPCDICVCAPTGCGKTLCYVISIVSALMNRVVQQVRALVVVPSQELASQVHSVFDLMARGTGLDIRMISGQAPLESEQIMLWERGSYPPSSKLDVLIATPGRLVEHLDSGSFASLAFLRFLVIDEADKLLDNHFNQWLPKLLRAVSRDKASPGRCGFAKSASLEKTLQGLCLHPERFKLMQHGKQKDADKVPSLFHHFHPPTSPLQKLLFSATMTQNPEHFALLQLHRPKLFSISDTLKLRGTGADASELTFGLPKQLVEKRVRCSLKHKPLALLHLIRGCGEGWSQDEMKKVLCFTNSKDSTHRLYLLLKEFGHFSVAEISSSITRGQRQKILADFKSGVTQVLICSDQMARGMDVEGVTCVVNYEAPRQFRIYLHRAGRTARAGQRGVVCTLLAQDEVHAFNVMMRQVRRGNHLDDVKIRNNDLQDYLPQYQDALDKLRQHI